MAQAKKADAVTGEKIDTYATAIGAPVVGAGVGIGVGFAASALVGLAVGGIVAGLLLALGLLLYFLVFKKNEKEADAEIAVLTKTTPPAPAPPTPAPAPTPGIPAPTGGGTVSTVAPLPMRPPWVQTKDPKQVPQQASMDRFMKKSWAMYELVDKAGQPLKGLDGKPLVGSQLQVWVSPAFRMVGGMNQPTPKEARDMIMNALTPAGLFTPHMKAAMGRIAIGRGSLDDIKDITQALIKTEGLTLNPKLKGAVQRWAAVRTLQWKFGIGLDCSGYVSEDRSNMNKDFGYPTDKMLDDTFKQGNKFNLAGDKRFERIATTEIPRTVQAGDVIRMEDRKGDVGHVVIVYETHELTDKDKAFYADARIDRAGLLKGGPVRIYIVDSSWGAGGNPEYVQAGVSRHQMFHNEATGQWAYYKPSQGEAKPYIIATDGPYDHLVSGVYRFKK